MGLNNKWKKLPQVPELWFIGFSDCQIELELRKMVISIWKKKKNQRNFIFRREADLHELVSSKNMSHIFLFNYTIHTLKTEISSN